MDYFQGRKIAIAIVCCYCNAVFKSTSSNWKLQLVQNVAAWTAIRISQYTWVILLLQDLHWLPVDSWECFKVPVLALRPDIDSDQAICGTAISALICSSHQIQSPTLKYLGPIIYIKIFYDVIQEMNIFIAVAILWDFLSTEIQLVCWYETSECIILSTTDSFDSCWYITLRFCY